jgi:hypothetical protein
LTCRLHALLAELKDLLGAVLVSKSDIDGQTASNLLGGSLQQLQSTACTSQEQRSASPQHCGQTCGASAAEELQEMGQHTCNHAENSTQSGSCQTQQLLSPGRPKPVLQLELPHGEATAATNPTTEPAAEALHCSCSANVQQQPVPAQSAPSQLQEHQHTQKQQQTTQALPSPLMLSTKLFKPCLADVVMHVRAQVRHQQ